jgi:hypothetical protein
MNNTAGVARAFGATPADGTSPEVAVHIRNKKDFIIGACFFLFAVFLFYETFFFRPVQSFSFGPRVFPRIILALTGVCALAIACRNLSFSPATGDAQTKRPDPGKKVLFMQAGLVLLLILYVASLRLLGYLPATILFLVLTMLLLGTRTLKWLAVYVATAVIVALSMQYIFGTLLRFFLP